jgi:putative ABC transport system permease protein
MVAFGGVDRYTEHVRSVRAFQWLQDLRQDARLALRILRRTPTTTAAVLLTFGLGTGAVTSVFSVMHAVVLRPLPYPEAQRVVRVSEVNDAHGVSGTAVSMGTFVDLHERTRTFDEVALIYRRDVLLTMGDGAAETGTASVSPALFALLGSTPILGRTFAEDDANSDGILISYGLWQRAFGGAAGVLGQTLQVEGRRTYTIVGVMGPEFAFPDEGVHVWMEEPHTETVSAAERQIRAYDVVARLAPGLSIGRAKEDVGRISAELAQEHPAAHAGWTIRLTALHESVVGGARLSLVLLFSLVSCLLLIACANVASLLVARAITRSHETAVRAALGAGYRRLLRQWLAEGLVLALLGGAVGLTVAFLSMQLLKASAPADTPRIAEVGLSVPVLVFLLVVTGLTAAVAGAAPALRLRGAGLVSGLNSGRRTTPGSVGGDRQALLAAQLALTFVLLVSTALLVRTFMSLRDVDLGFRSSNILALDLRVPTGRFATRRPWAERVSYFDQLFADLQNVPGVSAVAGVTDLPLGSHAFEGNVWRVDAAGAEGHRPPASAADQWRIGVRAVSPGYFDVMSIPLRHGRIFQPADRLTPEQLTGISADRPTGVAIINESMARAYWADTDPIGSSVVFFDDLGYVTSRTIVGVVGDTRERAVADVPPPLLYIPFAQHPSRDLAAVIRTDVAPAVIARAVQDRARSFDRQLGVGEAIAFMRIVERSISQPRFNFVVVGSIAVLALILAIVGIFGTIAHSVSSRQHEIGIRSVLGATASQTVTLILRDSLRPVAVGLVVGTIVALGVGHAMRGLLFGVPATDIVSFTAAASLLMLVAVAAALLPASRAIAIDPARALRSD